MTAPNVGPGNIPNVPGAQPVSELGFAAHAGRGESGWREQIDGQWKDRANNSGIGVIFTIITSLLSSVATIFGHLADLFDVTSTHDAAIADMQDAQQVLEGVVGYGQWYAPNTSGNSAGVTTRISRSLTQAGPSVGCYVDSGRVYLMSKGLWFVKLRTFVDENGNGGPIKFWLRCKMPNGALITESYFFTHPEMYGIPTQAFSRATTVNMWMDAVVPVPGCYVETWVWTDGSRNFPGGINNNAIDVMKMSNELGPGMRLSAPCVLTPYLWNEVGPMQATGGGSVVAGNRAVVGPGITSVRIDAVITASAPVQPYVERFNSAGVLLQTVVGAASYQPSHHLVWEGTVAPGDSFRIMAGSESGQEGTEIYSQSNATWLTIMNKL